MKRTTRREEGMTLLAPGTKAVKVSGKPFKSGSKEATVKAVVDHPVLAGVPAYSFEEDDSLVRASYCKAAT